MAQILGAVSAGICGGGHGGSVVVSSVMVPALMEGTSEGLSMDLEEASWIRELVLFKEKICQY